MTDHESKEERQQRELDEQKARNNQQQESMQKLAADRGLASDLKIIAAAFAEELSYKAGFRARIDASGVMDKLTTEGKAVFKAECVAAKSRRDSEFGVSSRKQLSTGAAQ